MPRIPYVFPDPGTSPVADEIRSRRKDGKLIELDGVFLNAPAIAEGYSHLLGAVRQKSTLDAALRELLILRVAALNSAAYEWQVTHIFGTRKAHEVIGRAAGLTDSQISAIGDVAHTHSPSPAQHPPFESSASALSPLFTIALAYTDAMTIDIKVPQEIFAALKAHLSDQQIMEVTATVASYNMVSRVLVALDVGDMADVVIPSSGGLGNASS
ncbi:carboxymuconolactone decarboxylase [Hysterangium stoloniferum]|nr:carboxymuconolactone decarboxylase [Hysterangium stoloniferum]